MPDAAIAVLIFILGLAFGSFANVVIWRLPNGESLSSPPSRCPICETPIRWFDNVPVLSWLLLRGRCRACDVSISARYPLVELASGLLWLLAWAVFGLTWKLPVAIALYYLLLVLSAIDLDTFRLPNSLVALMATIGFGAAALSQVGLAEAAPLIGGDIRAWPFASAVIGALAGSGMAWAIAVAYSAARGAQGLGMGDVKLLAAMGPFVGVYTVMVLFLGSILGTVGAVILSRHGRGDLRRKVPFGPALAAACVLVTIFGESVWAWYAGLLTP